MDMIAVIPARGGSKGLCRKNIKLLLGKPMIAYTIEAARDAGIFERIIVSTDDDEIADTALMYEAEVPFIRPESLSGDSISSDDVVLHVLDYFKDKDINYSEVCKLQPTSPLRTAGHLTEAYHIFKENNCNYVVSVCECEHSPLWCGTIGSDGSMDSFLEERYKRACRQQMDMFYRLNGAIYMGKTETYRYDRSFFGKGCRAYIMEKKDSIDIDDLFDFQIAEMIMSRKI
ncbi:MAG: acylneuraminate cytidylyltransferase family protein [Lachnospiraceae bacterium]|nr:acylneuraminate cytidylyltransferase family protein [Lachnospiraceae bacterium]MCI9658113.1 acylneuraminate cytidylyltransferase family protein [Lachnospiraceae bacterium]